MKKTIYIALVCLCILSACTKKEMVEASYDTIPLPHTIETKAGDSFILSENTKIVYSKGSSELEQIANF